MVVKALDFGGLQAVGQWFSTLVNVYLVLSTDRSLPGTSLLCHFPDSQYVSFLHSENASRHLVFLQFHRKLTAKRPQEMVGIVPCSQKSRDKEDYAYLDYN